MKKFNKKLIPIIAIVMAIVTVAGIILAAVLPRGNKPDDGTAFNELFTKDVLENMKVDDIVSDPKWGENLADATDGYIMVDANKFEFQEKVGAGSGYSKLYYNEKSKDIEMIEHSYVTYTNEKDPKEEINKIIANIQCNISGLLGEPAKSFMLMNTSGEFVDYEGLTVDEMVDKVISQETVMYVMYQYNGLRYEFNIMFSDDTVYTMVWVYEQPVVNSEATEHETK